MSGLTENQKRRIEINKQRALQLRAKRKEKESNSSSNKSLKPNTSNDAHTISSFYASSGHQHTVGGKPVSSNQQTIEVLSSGNKSSSYSSLAPIFNSPKTKNFNTFSNQTSFKSPSKRLSVRGCCVLKNPDRFEVQVGFHSGLIEVFKSIQSKEYGR